jgi:sugar (pentulose or hexulose) kinase
MSVPVVAIFDVGKTNKKVFLFDQAYRIVYEKSVHFQETTDEDGDPCEDVNSLRSFILDELQSLLESTQFRIRAVNFCSYGASFVYVDEEGKNVGPLYNYLKPYPEALQKKFYHTYGGENIFSFQTASPVLGSLNSGMQLYRVKHEKPDLFKEVKYALHLPQYLSYLVSGKAFSEITSIGCHTNLWHFQNMEYHYWVRKEGLLEKLPPLVPSDMVVEPASAARNFVVGVGLHDSSAALIPYLVNFTDPFVLLSTGTWSISLNPFNNTALTKHELECDSLCYLQYRGSPVKASRLFAGHFHDIQVKRLAEHFNKDTDRYLTIPFDEALVTRILQQQQDAKPVETKALLKELPFASRDLTTFANDAEAYHQLMYDLVLQQHASTQLVLKGTPVKRIYVDGGFSHNAVYMNLLAAFYPQMEVYASSIPQATAIGTALSIHQAWNAESFPKDLIELKHYPARVLIPAL